MDLKMIILMRIYSKQLIKIWLTIMEDGYKMEVTSLLQIRIHNLMTCKTKV